MGFKRANLLERGEPPPPPDLPKMHMRLSDQPGTSTCIWGRRPEAREGVFSGACVLVCYEPTAFRTRRARSVTHLFGSRLGPKFTQVLPL